MSRGARWAVGCSAAGCLGLIVLVLVIGAIVRLVPQPGVVGLVNVTGAIRAASGEGLLGGDAGAERTVTELERAAADPDVRAVVVRINSPGGSAAASQEIYDQMLRTRRKKPVVVSMGDVAASGGYYIAAGADTIYASPATITGSIGVISLTTDISGLLAKLGAKMEVVKAGKLKDMGFFARPMTAEERKLMQALLDDTHEQFIQAVAAGRRLPVTQIRRLADGRIYSGRQALKLKLVDRMGGLHDAIRYAAARGGIKGVPEVKQYGRRSAFEKLFGESARSLLGRLSLSRTEMTGPRPLEF